jgi:hypothetical protein
VGPDLERRGTVDAGTVSVDTYAAEPRIECTLEADRASDRLAQWHAIAAGAVSCTAVGTGALHLELGDSIGLGELARLVEAERQCCGFFSFTITTDAGGIALDVRAPDAAADIVTSMFGPPR